jgi:hypothetical protein
MAYNKILSNFKLNNLNVANDNTLYSTNNSFDFTDHFKPINNVNSIVLQNNDILINDNLNLLQTSNINELNSSNFLFSQDIGIKLLNTNEVSFFNDSISNNQININVDINIENELYINNNIFSSIAYTSSDETNKIIRSRSGGIVIDVLKDGIYDYFKLGLSNSSNQNGLNTNSNITFLSNNKSFNLQSGIQYTDNLDINYLTSNNKLLQINFVNSNNLTAVFNSPLTTFYSTNTLNTPNLFNIKDTYDNVANCTIFRPGNDINNLDYYLSGDSHFICIENNKNQFDNLNFINNIHLYLIDLTSQNFINKLNRGFKIEFLLGNFKNNLFSIDYDNVNRKQNAYPNYLPFRENITIQKNFHLGFPLINLTNKNSFNLTPFSISTGKINISQWGPAITSANATVRRTLISNSINVFATTSYPFINLFNTPLNPSIGDYFSFWYHSGITNGMNIYINGTNNLLTPKILNPMTNYLTWSWDGTNWIQKDDTPNNFSHNYDAGGLNYPSHILIELPTNHFISSAQNVQNILNYNNHSVYQYKNNKNFYLYGNKSTDSELINENLTSYLNGGWLYDIDNNLSVKSNFKKIYKNIYLLVANNSLKSILGFNWQPYSNFQLIYLGNNEWYIN